MQSYVSKLIIAFKHMRLNLFCKINMMEKMSARQKAEGKRNPNLSTERNKVCGGVEMCAGGGVVHVYGGFLCMLWKAPCLQPSSGVHLCDM